LKASKEAALQAKDEEIRQLKARIVSEREAKDAIIENL
jgi:hypothetical protein